MGLVPYHKPWTDLHSGAFKVVSHTLRRCNDMRYSSVDIDQSMFMESSMLSAFLMQEMTIPFGSQTAFYVALCAFKMRLACLNFTWFYDTKFQACDSRFSRCCCRSKGTSYTSTTVTEYEMGTRKGP